MYTTILDSMELASIVIGLFFDLRLVRNRKYVLVVVNFIMACCMLALYGGLADHPQTFFLLLLSIKCLDLVMCCIKNAYHI